MKIPECNNVKWMKHVLTIKSQTREGSTSCVGVPRGDRSTVGRSDEPCVISETCVLNVARRCRCSAPVAVTAVRARSEFKWRYDASETDPINSTADAVR